MGNKGEHYSQLVLKHAEVVNRCRVSEDVDVASKTYTYMIGSRNHLSLLFEGRTGRPFWFEGEAGLQIVVGESMLDTTKSDGSCQKFKNPNENMVCMTDATCFLLGSNGSNISKVSALWNTKIRPSQLTVGQPVTPNLISQRAC